MLASRPDSPAPPAQRRSGRPARARIRVRVLALALLLLAAAPRLRADDPPAVKWHHGPSPFRATYAIESEPSVPRAGYYLSVPDFGIGAGGEGIWVFDASGERQNIWTLGPTLDNCTLVLVAPDRGAAQGPFYAYFGGALKPPQAKGSFTPGLRLSIRACAGGSELESWDVAKKIYDASTLIGVLPVRNIHHAQNYFDNTDAIVMDYDGYLRADAFEDRRYLLASDDAGYFFVNDMPVIHRNGRHYASDVKGQPGTEVKLKPGLNPLKLIVIDAGGGQTASLVRWIDERTYYTVKPEEFVLSGFTRRGAVETRADAVCPAFTVTPLNYIGTETQYYTLVELKTLTGQSVEWRLENGARGEGPSFTTVVIGLENIAARARHDRHSEAIGRITFADIPAQASFQNPAHFQTYATVINAQALDKLDLPTLHAYFALLTQNERETRAVPVGRELFTRMDAKAKVLAEADVAFLMELARAAAATAPQLAHDAYLRRFNADPNLDPVKQRYQILEYVEFELFQGGDLDRAEKTLDQAARLLGREDRQLVCYRGLLAILRGQHDAARQTFADLRQALTAETDARALQVQSVEALERMDDFSRSGYYEAADLWWRRWMLCTPGGIEDGQIALQTAIHFQRLGWYAAGIRLIQAGIAYNDLPAFLPDLEFRQAELHRLAGEADKAATLYTRVAETYPNHPLAPLARQRLQGK